MVVENLVFSCGADPKKPQALWKKMADRQPDLMIWLGNNLSWEGTQHLPPQSLYHLQSLQPEFALFRSKFPVIGTWDNSDYGQKSPRNNGQENREGLTAKADYLNFFAIDSLKVNPRQEGIYHSFILGPPGKRTQIILLDEQSFRTPLLESENIDFPQGPYRPDTSKQATLLGAAQGAWLAAELKKPAEFRILVSPEQFLSESHGFQSWGNFPAAKKNLRSLLAKANIQHLLILSGNRLHGEVHREKSPTLEIIDVTAGGLNVNFPSADKRVSTRQGPLVNDNNYGWLEIRWADRQATVHLQTAGAEQTAVHWEF